jgi:hypothetical protein
MEKMPKLTIYQTFHKPFLRNKEIKWIQPIGVNGYTDEGVISDSLGSNISHLNASYCELTAQYWAWKNSNSEYIGFYHYRRYLNYCFDETWKEGCAFSVPTDLGIINYLTSDLQYETAIHLMSSFDALIPGKYASPTTISEHYKQHHIPEHWDMFIELLKMKYSDELGLIDIFDISNQNTCYNMFIMKRTLFNEYCSDLFGLLNQIYWKFGLKYDSYNNRYIGFLAERFLNFWLLKYKLRYLEVPMLMLS